MNRPDDVDAFVREFLASIAHLSAEKQERALAVMIGAVFNAMPKEGLEELMKEIPAQFSMDVPVVKTALEMVEGQLALRDMCLRKDAP